MEKHSLKEIIGLLKDRKISEKELLQHYFSKINKFSHVHYHPPVSYKELSCLLQSVDLHILFQKTTVVETNMPSKILAMMASGKPSLVIGNERSEVKQIFEKSNGGLFFKAYSEELIKELEKLTQNTSKYNCY